jgi:hypothetical protein
VCRKPRPLDLIENHFKSGVSASSRHLGLKSEAANAALRQQLIVLQRKVRGRVEFTNSDRLFFIQVIAPLASPI